MMKINFIDLQRQYQILKTDIDARMQRVITQSSFIMGPEIEELETTLAKYVGVPFAVSCASGTDALLLALMAYGVQPGDEIITTPFTFIATSEVISFLKAKPVFVDIDPDTFNINPQLITSAITKKTKGIIAVDLFGQCADYQEINALARERNLFVIEDAAQSFGAQYQGRRACSLTEVGCTSFFPAKPLGCYGDGGMVFTTNTHLAELMRSIRVHGKGQDKYDNVRIGLNARMDTLQAAIVLSKFSIYPKEIDLRQEVAKYYSAHLKEVVQVPKIMPHNLSVFAQYSLIVRDRERLQEHLKKHNIPTAVHYPKPLHLQGAFKNLGYTVGDLPISERTSENIISLPMHPYLTQEEQELIIQTIKSFYKK